MGVGFSIFSVRLLEQLALSAPEEKLAAMCCTCGLHCLRFGKMECIQASAMIVPQKAGIIMMSTIQSASKKNFSCKANRLGL
jgi:hypothetical protein